MTATSSRRSVLAATAAAALPRPALAQADQRPTRTIAVRRLSNSTTLEPPREQSNVGFRIPHICVEPLLETDWLGDLSLRPGLATGWRRIDAATVEFTLRPGVRLHDGREVTAEDVAFSFGPRTAAARNGEWTNAELDARSSTLNTSVELAERRAAFRGVLEILEREDPGCIVLHQAAGFAAKRRDIAWRAAKGWAMDFRAANLRFGA